MSILQKLTEGVQSRDMRAEGTALLNKWEATGLLEGLGNEAQKQGMAVLLENQAKELLREASSMAAGDVEGFAAVAFPIVRRVFGGLIANDLVSVQPMSLPSGLIFFMDFTHSDGRGGLAAEASLYGGGVVGRELVDGVTDIIDTGFYGLGGHGYSSATGSFVQEIPAGSATGELAFKTAAVMGTQAGLTLVDYDPDMDGTICFITEPTEDVATAMAAQVDPKNPAAIVLAPPTAGIDADTLTSAAGDGKLVAAATHVVFVDPNNPADIVLVSHGDSNSQGFGAAIASDDKNLAIVRLRLVRRLTRVVSKTTDGIKTLQRVSKLVFRIVGGRDVTAVQSAAATLGVQSNGRKLSLAWTEDDALNDTDTTKMGLIDNLLAHEALGTARTAAECVAADPDGSAIKAVLDDLSLSLTAPIRDSIADSSNAIGAVVGQDTWGLEEPQSGTGKFGSNSNKNAIAEIDIKVDSVAVTAQTRKLKAKWTPELGQDLNAYHNLDAEVELTGILSEQIALEIDRELLGELVRGATAGTRYWSRAPGLFVNAAGSEIGASSAAPDFTGTVSEWYETLIETINDVSAQIHRKTLRGGANFVVCSPEVANILEFTSGFRASVTADQDRGTIGAVKSGSLSKKFDVYVDPYFLRNVLLVGRKGGSFLESGYVYAPYVPLQVTPTIFGTEDFVPRKGVMTRYAKKMVRPDMYGLVIVRGLLGEAGATA